jgi:hypothetical protein
MGIVHEREAVVHQGVLRQGPWQGCGGSRGCFTRGQQGFLHHEPQCFTRMCMRVPSQGQQSFIHQSMRVPSPGDTGLLYKGTAGIASPWGKQWFLDQGQQGFLYKGAARVSSSSGQQGFLNQEQWGFLHLGAAGVPSPWGHQGFLYKRAAGVLSGSFSRGQNGFLYFGKSRGSFIRGGGVLLPRGGKDCFTRIKGKMP